ERTRDDLAQPGVLRRVHVEQDEPAGVEMVARAVLVPRDRGLLQAGEHVAAQRYVLDVPVPGDDPKAAIVEATRTRRLLTPPDRRGPAQLGQFLDGQALHTQVGIGGVEPGAEVRSRHVCTPQYDVV